MKETTSPSPHLHLSSACSFMAELIASYGECALKPQPAGFHHLVKIIANQQLSGKAAATIYGRVEKLVGGKVTPERILAAKEKDLRAAGLSFSKIASAKAAATAVQTKQLKLNAFAKMTNEEISEAITAVKGLGPWSAQMYLMFVLVRPDILPLGDLGIRTALKKRYKLKDSHFPDSRKLRTISERWKPFRTYASWYLWRSLEPVPEKT